MTAVATNPDADEGVDPALLAEARHQLGDVSEGATINAALKQFVDQGRERRGSAYDNVQRMVAEGLLDLDAIERLDE